MAETDVPTATVDFLWSDEGFFDEVYHERWNQYAKWGDQHWPNGTATSSDDREMADEAKRVTNLAMEEGDLTWRDILVEEIFEAFAESDWSKLRVELVQSAAVIAAWIEDGDRAETERKAKAKDALDRFARSELVSTPVHHADQGTEGRN
jgi:hypothetical protein